MSKLFELLTQTADSEHGKEVIADLRVVELRVFNNGSASVWLDGLPWYAKDEAELIAKLSEYLLKEKQND